ncbi:MAG: RagB/SusD family nutrient uptake outer membrane protein [Marinilabiliaceae bacterium]|nr:RagB/SusD family nutrient uptake outer membrane protein [Marinilabiliaceae bacterium]
MKLYKSIFAVLSAALTLGSLTSCEDYLDKEPDSDVNPEEAFKNFTNFQGFVEQMYNSIPTKTCNYWNTTFNWGEDEILTLNNADFYVTSKMDKGDFKAYYTSWGGNLSFLYGNNDDVTSKDRMKHHIWNDSWYCIRKANLGLEALEQGLMTDATEEERNFVKGQLLFFRAWWYEELMVWLGGLPYLERVPDALEVLSDPRLSFQECALKAAKDFEAAAELLPNNWDNTTVGKRTMGQNKLRITKSTALAYAGKVMLWAASPLNENGAKVGGSDTYKYNETYAKQAGEYLGKSLALIESGETPYELAEYYDADDFDALYNHDRKKTTNSCYSDIFYTIKQNFKQPGTVEAMMRGTVLNGTNDARWGFCTSWGSNVGGLFNGSFCQVPTANYVNYYGMANGLPLDDPDSGFDPTHPFKNRDPRFYHDIVFDGERFIDTDAPKEFTNQQYATLSTGGIMRDVTNGSRTGYFCQKLIPHSANKVDKIADDWGSGLKSYLPYMRVADVYLMYAEAGAAVQGAAYKSTTFSKTAEEAINTLRDRVGCGHVNAKFTANKEKFMDEVRRERAVELAFEGFRFNDLQRWLLLTEEPYTVKTSQEFDRVYDDSWYTTNDPRDAEVKNWRQTTLLKRNYGTKHYWFPIIEKETYIYEQFAQNPGW